MKKGALKKRDIEALVAGTHADPFGVLGLHKVGKKTLARMFAPFAKCLCLLDGEGAEQVRLELVHGDGVFEGIVPEKHVKPVRYRATNDGGSWEFFDPYSFGPVLGPTDDYLMVEGSHHRLFDKLGAHKISHEGISGVHFAVWAPNASRVSVVGPFNDWDGRRHIMRFRADTGIWEIFLPELLAGEAYKYEIVDAEGKTLPLKADPFAQQSELRPANASVIVDPEPFVWRDADYLKRRRQIDWRRTPMSIYEVHLGSWKRREDGTFLSYGELAEQLIPYAKEMGFTHLELLPISEYPYDPSWGYQPVGMFSPTARFGDPAEFAAFVDAAHQADLGIIIDWVPAHFPTDEHGLSRFDGTALYEHADPRKGFHPDWNTAIYNFGRREVVSYLINNALFWLEKYHIDGLRVDAVASMLYLDYSRKEGEWIPNKDGGNLNLEAIEFLKRFNAEVYGAHPGIFTVAEESTSFPLVSAPVDGGGLGFGFKWNMGFMNDTLKYMARDPVHRSHHHNEMTFGTMYAFSENFVLPLSHDEVVHGKGSLLNKMSGGDWQQFATLRAYYGFMWAYPGKKLLFMGQEFAQRNEWDEGKGLDWELLDAGMHVGVRRLIKDLNKAYLSLPALHGRDCEPEGFEWLVADDKSNSVLAWMRQTKGQNPIVVVSNFTPQAHNNYCLPAPVAGCWREIINTDAAIYGGSDQGNSGVVNSHATQKGGALELTLPPLSTLILQYDSE